MAREEPPLKKRWTRRLKAHAGTHFVGESAAHEGSDRQHACHDSRYAITFGEVAVLHFGGCEVGAGIREHGFSVSELRAIANKLALDGVTAELIDLSAVLPPQLGTANAAATLVIRDGASLLLQEADAADALFREQVELVHYDSKYWDSRRSRTLNKRARRNIVFGEESIAPSKDFKQCTVKGFGDLPKLGALRALLPKLLGESARGLLAEGNQYFEESSGIGFHGDSERKIVICLSLGRSATLRYHWRMPGSSEHTLPPIDVAVHHGDMYVMSEKATGNDWRMRSRVRVVHGAGAQKFIGAA